MRQMGLKGMKAIMTRMKNAKSLQQIRSWREACQKELMLAKMQAEANAGLMDELAQAKQGGALGMMKLIYKKMQNAVYSRYVMNWKKNRSCTILEGKIDGGGLAFLEDAKRKEKERAAEEEEKIKAERLREQREKEKRDAGLRMMRRVKARWEGDEVGIITAEIVRNFHQWKKEQFLASFE